MTFRVDLENFASAVERLIGVKVAAVAFRDGATIVTAGDATKGLIVGCSTRKPQADVREFLKEKGIEVLVGEWGEACEFSHESGEDHPPYLVAIAYKSRESTPGLWVDAFPTEPTNAEALKALYDEFETTGEASDVTFEEFVRLANPNVLVLSPNEVTRFARSHHHEE